MAMQPAHFAETDLSRLLRGMPLLWFSLAYLSGLLLASAVSLSWWQWTAGSLVCLLLLVLERRLSGRFWSVWRRFSALPLTLLAAALLLGAARFQFAQPQLTSSSLAYYQGSRVVLQALVVTPPQAGASRVSLRLQVLSLSLRDVQDREVSKVEGPSGLLLARVSSGTDWHYGDQLQVSGTLSALADNTPESQREALYRQDIRVQMADASARLLQHDQGSWWLSAADNMRRSAQKVIYQLFPQPEAALLSGILLGNDDDLPLDLQTAFQDSGTAHIIAISGFNMAIVAGLLTLFAGRLLPRGWSLLPVTAGIIFYTLLTGATPSVVRAAVMGFMGLLGGLIGRRQMGINSLVFTAAVMSLFDPFLPWGASFQLSFGATLGLVWYAEGLETFAFGLAGRFLPEGWARQVSGWAGEFLLCTLAAQITTLPVMLYHFQRLSLSALLANVLVLPPQSAVMILGGLALLLGWAVPVLGQIAAYPAWVLLAYTTRMVTLLAQIPGSVLYVQQIPLWLIGLMYALMLLFTPGVARVVAPLKNVVRPGLILLSIGLAATLVMRFALSQPDGLMEITLLGGGQQATLLVRTPGGQTLLLNGATQSGNLSSELGKRLTPLDRNLGAWILTDASSAPLQEFDLLTGRFNPGLVYRSVNVTDSTDWRRVSTHLALQGATANRLQDGMSFDLGQGASLRVLAVSPRGTALLLEWRNLSLLVPGGLDGSELLRLAERQNWQGALVALSAGDLANTDAESSWSQAQPLLVLLAGGGTAVPPGWLDTARLGWIELKSDGSALWIQTGR